MGLQSKAEACGAALKSDDTAFPQNLVPASQGSLRQSATGVVTGRDNAVFELKTAGKTLQARRAVSCLIEPQAADTVALLSTAEGVFITDVLVRADESGEALRMTCMRDDGSPGDLVLAAGSLRIEAEGSVEATGKSLSMRFDNILMTSRQLALVGKKLLTSMRDLVTSAKSHMASFDTTSTRARNRIDRVTEADQLKAGSIQTQADTVALTQAESALFVAKEDIRLDGKRISMS